MTNLAEHVARLRSGESVVAGDHAAELNSNSTSPSAEGLAVALEDDAGDAGRAVGAQFERARGERELGPVVAAGADVDGDHLRAVAGGGAPRAGVEVVLGDDDHRAARLAGGGLGQRRDLRQDAARRLGHAVDQARRAGGGRHRERVGKQAVDLQRAPGATGGGRPRPRPRSDSRATRSAALASRQRRVGGEAEAVAADPGGRRRAHLEDLEVERARPQDAARQPRDLLDGRQDRRAETVGQLGERGPRVGGAEDQVIEREKHGAARYRRRASTCFQRRGMPAAGNVTLSVR